MVIRPGWGNSAAVLGRTAPAGKLKKASGAVLFKSMAGMRRPASWGAREIRGPPLPLDFPNC